MVKSPAHPDLAVVVPRCNASAVPGESTAPDTFMMSLQRVDALPGVAVPQLGRQRHLESKPGTKDIRSVPKRMSDQSYFRVWRRASEHVTYIWWNVIMEINTAVFVLINTHYAARFRRTNNCCRAASVMCTCSLRCLSFPGFLFNPSLSLSLESIVFSILLPPLPYPGHILRHAENNTAHN